MCERPAWQGRARWLQALSPEAIERVEQATTVSSVAAGEAVLVAGEPVPGWFGVVEGFVVAEPATASTALPPCGLPAGAWHGDGDLLLARPSTCTLRAHMPSTVARVPQAVFAALLTEEPGFTRALLQLHAQRLAALQQRLQWPRRLGTDARVALRLADLFTPAWLFDGRHRVTVTQSVLAVFLGLSRQRTNEALNHLRRIGAVDLVYGEIEVPTPERLVRLALCGGIR